MIEEQTIIAVMPETLVAETRKMRDQGYRLVQICVTRLGEELQLDYSFDLNRAFVNFRFLQPKIGARVPSISSIYWCAFTYENEISDLFGVQVDGNALDFKGTFYKTAMKHPFIQDAEPASVVASANPEVK
ncbi:MAG: NADH-quinone oxidoreductase subunit C [bacterium]